MNIQMGSQHFRDVAIPLLWGTRAVLQDRKGRLSVVDLAGAIAKLEIVGDKPAPGVEFEPSIGGVIVMVDGNELYEYVSAEKLIRPISLKLPECQVLPWGIRVGGSTLAGNMVAGYGVGIAVTESSLTMGAPLPPGLARLAV